MSIGKKVELLIVDLFTILFKYSGLFWERWENRERRFRFVVMSAIRVLLVLAFLFGLIRAGICLWFLLFLGFW